MEKCKNYEYSRAVFEQNDPMEMVLSPKSLEMMTTEQFERTLLTHFQDEETIRHFGWMLDKELIKRGYIKSDEIEKST